jgi:putative Holliday junction resolvase
MKIMALDLGNAWVGIALTDPLQFFAKPYKTVAAGQLVENLEQIFAQEKISTVVIGYPKTMRGTESDQTKLVVATKEELEKNFPAYTWVLWDERLSSKQAAIMKPAKNKSDKLEQHSIAAAIILESYLPFSKQS